MEIEKVSSLGQRTKPRSYLQFPLLSRKRPEDFEAEVFSVPTPASPLGR